jgi:molecular chaperone GrpE
MPVLPEETRQDPMADGAATPPDGTQAGEADLYAQLATKDDEVRSLVDRLKRLQAEFENYRKRILRDLAAAEERTSDREILAFLPLYDNLARAFSAYAKDADVDAFVAGVERIFGQFAQILDQKGVERIPAIGERFDPSLHEALLSVHSQQERNVILEEFSPGYVRGDRTLQPSKVTVSQGPAQEEKEE